MKTAGFILALVGLSAVACPPTEDNLSDADKACKSEAAIADLPVSVAVKQRSSTSVPGVFGGLVLTVGDVTSGQVMVTLAGKSETALLGPLSMRRGDAAEFQLGCAAYSLRLAELNNAILGDDFATFAIDASGAGSPTESQKIDRLIKAVETMPDAVFTRNGADYSASDAAKHLRRKREATKDDVRTAEKFIDQVASKSSITGEDYTIRFSDGRTTLAREFLREKLSSLDASREPSDALEPAISPNSDVTPSPPAQ